MKPAAKAGGPPSPPPPADQRKPWRNRIVGQGEEVPDQLLANPENWRTHPKAQREALRGSLTEVGWVQQVIVNRTTGHLVDGHARVEEAISAGASTVPVLYVELTPEEERLVLASLDPIGAMAQADATKLEELLASLNASTPGLQVLLDSLGVPELPENAYTEDVNVPQYQIVGERPAVSSLCDETRAEQLREAIRTADVDEPIRAFLLLAASRHVVFDYRRIAEFYPHASPEVQRLMEDSALVIIDFGDAIRNGYVRLSATLAELQDG